MKKNTIIALAALCLLWLPIASTGCKSTSPERATVNTLKSATFLIEELEDAWGDYVVAGKATESQRIAVEAAHERYRASMALVRSSVIAASVIGGDKAELDVQAAINQLTSDKIVLINLIKEYVR